MTTKSFIKIPVLLLGASLLSGRSTEGPKSSNDNDRIVLWKSDDRQ
jgi:hypothetical protein